MFEHMKLEGLQKMIMPINGGHSRNLYIHYSSSRRQNRPSPKSMIHSTTLWKGYMSGTVNGRNAERQKLYSGRLDELICNTVHSDVSRKPNSIRYVSRTETQIINSPYTLTHQTVDGPPWNHKSQCLTWSRTIAIRDTILWLYFLSGNFSNAQLCLPTI